MAPPSAELSNLEGKGQQPIEQGPFFIPGDEEKWRVRFYSHGAAVRGWPAKGGFYALNGVHAVEMDFLGLDRFKEADRPKNFNTTAGAEAEETHCRRMRQLGARWWRSGHAESTWWFKNPKESWDPLTKPVTYFGWPADGQGGVWALNTTLYGASEMGAGRIHIAITMEERCKIMEELGAVYYANPEDCPLLDLSDPDEAVSAGGIEGAR